MGGLLCTCKVVRHPAVTKVVEVYCIVRDSRSGCSNDIYFLISGSLLLFRMNLKYWGGGGGGG